MTRYFRPQLSELLRRLAEPRRFLQVLAGPRQVGKTTLARQAAERSGLPTRYASADQPGLRGSGWLEAQWEAARRLTGEADREGALLILDEIQKIPGWSEIVKRRWDEDAHAGLPLKVVLCGSAPLLVFRGVAESLAGRFELLRVPHWSFGEMRAAFGCSLDEFVFYGGYPGARPLVSEPKRWRRYILDALIEPAIARDVLLLSRVDKPALLRRLFELGCAWSGQVLSFTKMLGQLQEAGNTTTLAHYLDLLGGAGMLTGLGKYSESAVRRRASSPKLQVFDNALISAQSDRSFAEARADPAHWGRLVESAVGAHLLGGASSGGYGLHYWRERNREVDFVVRGGRRLLAVEVKSGRPPEMFPGLAAFARAFPAARVLLVGGDGVPLDEFLSRPAAAFLDE